MKLIQLNFTNLTILSLTLNLTTTLYCPALNPWPATRALFWTKIPMKKGGHIDAFVTNPVVRAEILSNHAKYRVGSLIRDMPQDFYRTLSHEDRSIELKRMRQHTETVYSDKCLSDKDPVAKYIETLTACEQKRHSDLTIKPKIFLARGFNTEPIILRTVGPDIIIDHRKFMALGNPTQSAKKIELTAVQQFLLNTTWQALVSGDHYVTTKLNKILELKEHKDIDLTFLKKQCNMIIMAQKLRNDLLAASTDAIDNVNGTKKLMGAGIHIYSQLAHQQYSRTSVIDSLSATKIRLAGLIYAQNLIESTDRRN